jgi:hypothetical protein
VNWVHHAIGPSFENPFAKGNSFTGGKNPNGNEEKSKKEETLTVSEMYRTV